MYVNTLPLSRDKNISSESYSMCDTISSELYIMDDTVRSELYIIYDTISSELYIMYDTIINALYSMYDTISIKSILIYISYTEATLLYALYRDRRGLDTMILCIIFQREAK